MAFVIAAYAYENGFLSVKLQDVTQSKVLLQELAKGGYHEEIILSIPHIYISIYLYVYIYIHTAPLWRTFRLTCAQIKVTGRHYV